MQNAGRAYKGALAEERQMRRALLILVGTTVAMGLIGYINWDESMSIDISRSVNTQLSSAIGAVLGAAVVGIVWIARKM